MGDRQQATNGRHAFGALDKSQGKTVAALLAGACLAGFLLAGCRQQDVGGPPTVPLTVRLVFKKGGQVKDLADRSVIVQFQSAEQPDLQAFGTIQEDGTLVVATQFEGRAKPGIVPGKHRARINADENSAHLVAPRFLRYETSGWTVTAPSASEIVLEVWK